MFELDEDGDIDIVDQTVRGARIAGQEFDRIRLRDVVLEECDLSGVTVQAALFTRVTMRGCRLSGLQASGMKAKELIVSDTKADGVNLRASSLEKCRFTDSDLTDLDIGAATFDDVAFIRCTLVGMDMHRARLSRVALHGSRVDGLRNVTGGLIISNEQVIPVALAVFASAGVRVDDDYDVDSDSDH